MISQEEVKKVAKLARLNVSDSELQTMSQKLNNITDLIDQMREVDTGGVEPLTSVCNTTQPLRKDEVTEGNITEDLFKNVPSDNADFAREIKCFIVPKMVE